MKPSQKMLTVVVVALVIYLTGAATDAFSSYEFVSNILRSTAFGMVLGLGFYSYKTQSENEKDLEAFEAAYGDYDEEETWDDEPIHEIKTMQLDGPMQRVR